MIQAVSKVGENVVKPFKLDMQVDSAQAEVEYAAMWMTVAEHQLAEVSIEGDENALIPQSDCQNLGVLERWGIVSCDKCDIVPMTPEIRSDPSISTLVNEKSREGNHEDGWTVLTSFGRGGRTCTAWRAYAMHAFTSSSVSRG